MNVKSTAVAITGMHRSGTSLVASLLARSGLDLGSNLLGSDRGNPRGYFEDAGIVGLQDRQLRRWFGSFFPTGPVPPAPQELLDRARAAVASRSGVWGFKDPRSCHFLPVWEEILPRPRFVFVVRHPLEVVDSLLRRASDPEILVSPMLALTAWKLSHESILELLDRGRSPAVVLPIAAIAADPVGCVREIARRLDLHLEPDRAADVFEESELRRFAAPEADSLLGLVAPETLRLWRRVLEEADPSRVALPARDTPPTARTEDLVRRWAHSPPSLALWIALHELAPATIVQCEAELTALGQEIPKLRADLTRIECHRDELAAHASHLERELERVTEVSAGHRLHARNVEEEVDRLRGAVAGLTEHTENLEKELGRVEGLRADLEARLAHKAADENGVDRATGDPTTG